MKAERGSFQVVHGHPKRVPCRDCDASGLLTYSPCDDDCPHDDCPEETIVCSFCHGVTWRWEGPLTHVAVGVGQPRAVLLWREPYDPGDGEFYSP